MNIFKNKPWLEDIVRVDNPITTRHGKVRLDKSERVCHYPDEFHEAFIANLSQEDFISYPEPHALKEQLAQYWNRNTNEIVIGAGIDALIKVFFESFVDKGQEVIGSDPCFPMYRVYASLYAARYRAIAYLPGPIFDFETLIDSITADTSAVMLANPNSPIGDYQSNISLKRLLERSANYNVPVLLDEAYIEFAPSSAIDLLDEYQNLAIARTFSKAWGAAGLRVAYMLASPAIVNRVEKWRPMYEANQIGVVYAQALLKNDALIQEYAKDTVLERSRLVNACRSIGCDVIDSHTNFVHIHAKEKNQEFLAILDAQSVLYKKASIPHDPRSDWVRLSVGPGIVNSTWFRAAMACLKD